MRAKSIKQKLLEKLYKEHGIILDPMDMVSYRRNGFGSRIISWGTISNKPAYQSFEKMADCLKYPTKLVRHNFGQDREITIEIDFEKIASGILEQIQERQLTQRAPDFETGTANADSESKPAVSSG